MGDIDAPIVTLNLPLIGVIETLHATVSGLALQTLLDLLVGIIARQDWNNQMKLSLSHLLMTNFPSSLQWIAFQQM